MGKQGYSLRYRGARYRRRRISAVIIPIVAVFVVLTVLFFVIGNALNDKTQGENENHNGDGAQVPTAETEKQNAVPSSVVAYALDIEGAAAASLAENISALSGKGAKAVSVRVKGSGGALLYNSAVAKAMGYQSGSGLLNIENLVSRAESRGMYVSAFLELEALAETNAEVRALKLAYEASVASELCSAGVDDVMIYARDAGSKDVSELVRLADSIKAINRNARIGIALDQTFFKSENSAVDIDELSAAFDFLGLKFSAAEGVDVTEELERVIGEELYYILRYNVRIVVPSPSSEENAQKISAILSEESVGNVQYVK